MGRWSRIGVGLLLLRVGVGLVFLLHGLPKAADPTQAAALFAAAGIPWPETMALLSGLLETTGGLAILAGLATRAAGVLLAAEMAVAIARGGIGRGFIGGWELEFLLLVAAMSIALVGPGEYTVAETEPDRVRPRRRTGLRG